MTKTLLPQSTKQRNLTNKTKHETDYFTTAKKQQTKRKQGYLKQKKRITRKQWTLS